jgi:hypothetical protein
VVRLLRGWHLHLVGRQALKCLSATPLLISMRGAPVRRRLKVYPHGGGVGKGTHLSVFLEAQDTMWVPSATFKFTAVNKEAVKSVSKGQSWL